MTDLLLEGMQERTQEVLELVDALHDTLGSQMADISALTSHLEDQVAAFTPGHPVQTTVVLGAAMQLMLTACNLMAKHGLDNPTGEEEHITFIAFTAASAMLLHGTAINNEQWEDKKQ